MVHVTISIRNNRNSLDLQHMVPIINQPHDARFGRSSELPGEDPYFVGQYAAHMVSGMQETDAAGYPKILAYLKHFTAYSRETNREHDDCRISQFDLWDSYLP